MKKIFLATALAAASLTVANAKWDGFYIKGGAAFRLNGATNMTTTDAGEIQTHNGNRCYAAALIDLAGGYGAVVGNAVYLGVALQPVNIKFALENPLKNWGSIATFTYRPFLQGRIGLPMDTVMPYVAAGVGYMKTTPFTSPEVRAPELPNGMSFSARLGVDIKTSNKWVFGGYVQFEHCTVFDENNVYQDENEVVTGLTLGYVF
jgi:opacity protein-like surface antigen